MYLAYCGLLCDECPVYIATKNDDAAMREALAAEYSAPECVFEPRDMLCDGCHSQMAADSRMCGDCDIRACAVERGVRNCGGCAEYPCAAVESRLPADSEYRLRLDEVCRVKAGGCRH